MKIRLVLHGLSSGFEMGGSPMPGAETLLHEVALPPFACLSRASLREHREPFLRA